MIGISIAAKKEWEATLNYFGLNHEECEKYPFGEYFKKSLITKKLFLFRWSKKNECISIYSIYDRSL